MRISRQTSGGRGEYEIAENHGPLRPTDLAEKRLIFDFGDNLAVNTNVVLRLSKTQGKRRLRRLSTRDMQIPRQLAAALLMPKPVRVRNNLGSGQPVVQRDRYAIEDIEFASITSNDDAAIIRTKELIVGNHSHHAEVIRFDSRVRDMKKVWAESRTFSQHISDLIQEHETMVRNGGPIPEQAERKVDELQNALADESSDLGITYIPSMDVLPALIEALGGIADEPLIHVDDIEPEHVEIRKRSVGEWKRWATARGNKSAVFRKKVREAYQSTCVVCGESYPPTDFNRKPGVDAAHILPWAQYDLDVVGNGLCLCKTHHWAFDEGLLEIIFENERYKVRIPASVAEIIGSTTFSLRALSRYAGEIPNSRLPSDHSDWPRPEFLQKLREATEGLT